MGTVLALLLMAATARAQFSMLGRAPGTSTPTSTGGVFSLKSRIGPGSSPVLSGGEFRVRATPIIRTVASVETGSDPRPPVPDHWWKLDDDLVDAISGERGVALNGEAYWPGVSGRAFDLRGSNYLDLGTVAGDFGTNDFTLTLWLSVRGDVGTPTLLSWRTRCGALAHWWARLSASDLSHAQPAFSFYSSSGLQLGVTQSVNGPVSNVKDGRWHHVAYVRNSTNLLVYLDGFAILAGQTTRVADLPAVGRLLVGIDPCNIDQPWPSDPTLYNDPFLGQLDDIRIYRRALTPAMIATEWKQSRPLPIKASSVSHVTLESGPASQPFLRWRIDALPGQALMLQDLAGVQLESSPDLRQWFVVPDAVRLVDGAFELVDWEAFGKNRSFYRIVFR